MSMKASLVQTLYFGRYLRPRQYMNIRPIPSVSSLTRLRHSYPLTNHTATTPAHQQQKAAMSSASASKDTSSQAQSQSQSQSSPSSSSSSPPSSTQQQQQEPTTTTTSNPLPLPEPPTSAGKTSTTTTTTTTHQLTVDGAGVKLDHLGPLVVNVDGTMSRIANWEKMADIERENTVRIIGKRNQARLAKLRGAAAAVARGEQPEGQEER